MNSMRLSLVLVVLASALQAEPIPFRRAVELGVQRSTIVSAAEQNRAHQAYLAAVRLYIPQLIVGSGLAKTFGYPLSIEGSAPSIANVNATGFLINPSNRETIRAAHAEWDAAAFGSEDRKQQAILDTAVTYTQLDRLVTALHLLRQEEEESTRAEQITGERVQAGVEPALDLTRSRLATARVHMAIARVEGDIDMLRNVLAQLTGLPAQGIETITESIPALPEISQSSDVASKAASTNPTVKLAFAHADAKQFLARGEHKQFLPAVDFVAQYSRFATYNNYEVFFPPGTFRRNNGLIGVAVRFPFFNMSQRARAAEADAEAVQARRQAEDAKNKVSNETRKLQHEVAQLAAAREVARLEYQLARADVDTVQTKVQGGSATLGDEANARLAEGRIFRPPRRQLPVRASADAAPAFHRRAGEMGLGAEMMRPALFVAPDAVAVVVAITCAYLVLRSDLRRRRLTPNPIIVTAVLVLGAIAGAAILAPAPENGACLGVVVAALIMARVYRASSLVLLDVAAAAGAMATVTLCVALFLTYGPVADLLAGIASAAAFLWLWQEGRRSTQWQRPRGIVAGEYLVLSGLVSFAADFLRSGARALSGLSQLGALVSILAGAILLAVIVPRYLRSREEHRIIADVSAAGDSLQPEYTPATPECPHPELWKMYDSMSAEVEVLDFLKSLVVALKPKLVVETGTFMGVSTLAIAEGLKQNGFGRVITVEFDPKVFAKAKERFDASGLASWIDARNHSSLDLQVDGTIDLLFSDSDINIREREVRYLLPHISPHGLILIHDASSHQKVVREAALRLEAEGLLSVVLMPTPRGLVLAQKRAQRR